MKTVKVGETQLGDGHPRVCVPICGRNREEVLSQAEQIVQMEPDLIEWRCDVYDSMYVDEIENMLIDLKNVTNKIPLIFTFRTDKEGGKKFISNQNYYDLNVAVAKTGLADLIDVESYTKDSIAVNLIEEIHQAGAKVIGSNHNFEETPTVGEMVEKLMVMEELGADICKLAVMPKGKECVDRLICASIEAAEKMIAPIITMSMGELGSVTRVCCNLTKSAVTFAAGVDASAPGQIECAIVKDILKMADEFEPDYNLFLVGFMGTGKTTVSSELQKITGLEEIDMDSYIVKKEGMSIVEIFRQKGEQYFRDVETETLNEFQQTKGKIISCGGGIVLRDENIKLMKRSGKVVLLTATPETIYKRVKDNHTRPALNDDMSIEHIVELMKVRQERYDMAADIFVSTDKNDRVWTCYEILKKL